MPAAAHVPVVTFDKGEWVDARGEAKFWSVRVDGVWIGEIVSTTTVDRRPRVNAPWTPTAYEVDATWAPKAGVAKVTRIEHRQEVPKGGSAVAALAALKRVIRRRILEAAAH